MEDTDACPRNGSVKAWPAVKKAYLALGILLLAAAIAQSFRLHLPARAYHLINFLPATVLLLGQHICFRHPNAKWIHWIIIGGGAMTLAVAVLLNVGMELFIRELSPVTDTKKYGEILGKWENAGVQHFPKTIPPEAKDARFYFHPGFMQGGEAIQLRLKLPASQVETIYIKYGALATFRFTGGDSSIHINLPDGVPTTFFYTSGTKDKAFPNFFEILFLGPYTLDQVRESHNKAGYFNHGQSYGVACDRAHSEVVYWSEHW